MFRPPPRSTRTYTPFPSTTLFRSPSCLDARLRDLIGTQCDDALVGVAAFSTALFRASSRFVAGCPIGGRLVPGVLATTGSQQQGERRRAREIETLHH